MATIKVSGLKEVEKQLRLLGAKEGTRVLRAAMMRATKPIEDQAKANVAKIPNGSGALEKSISRRFVIGRQQSSLFLPDLGGRFAVVIAPIKSNRVAVALHNLFYKRKRRGIFYGHFIEFGHRIARGARLKRSAVAITRAVARGDFSGLSTGMAKPMPFLRPALDARAPQAIAALGNEIRAGIKRALKRRAKR